MEGQGQRSQVSVPLALPEPDEVGGSVPPGCLLHWTQPEKRQLLTPVGMNSIPSLRAALGVMKTG